MLSSEEQVKDLTYKSCYLHWQVVRAIRFMSETTPVVANRVLLVQIVKELIAAEKLRVVETKQDHGRVTGDRFRKDTRPQHSN